MMSIHLTSNEVILKGKVTAECTIAYKLGRAGKSDERLHTYMRTSSLRKTGDILRRHLWFPAKERLRNERRNSILMTRHYPDLRSASDWLKQISHAARPIRSTTQIWVVARH